MDLGGLVLAVELGSGPSSGQQHRGRGTTATVRQGQICEGLSSFVKKQR